MKLEDIPQVNLFRNRRHELKILEPEPEVSFEKLWSRSRRDQNSFIRIPEFFVHEFWKCLMMFLEFKVFSLHVYFESRYEGIDLTSNGLLIQMDYF